MCTGQPHYSEVYTHTASEMSIEHLTQKNPFWAATEQYEPKDLTVLSFYKPISISPMSNRGDKLDHRSVTKPPFPRRKPTAEGRLVRLSSSGECLLLSWWARVSFLQPAPESYPLTITNPKIKGIV